MSKQQYYFRLLPPRPTFSEDITATERSLMEEHVRYTHDRLIAGDVMLFGPVFATDGAFGIAILDVADEAAARAFGDNDPSVRAGMNTFEFHRMRVAGIRGS